MIPEVIASLSPNDNRTICLDASWGVSSAIKLWLKHKVERQFYGTIMYTETIHVINAFINQQLYRLLNLGYIYNMNTRWIVCKPLFRWRRDES